MPATPMKYAEVSVNSPIAQRRTFSYAIPPSLDVVAGQAVWVPFGNKTLQGVVLELTQYPAVEETREIIGLIESRPLLSPIHIQLARWISEHYLSPLFDAVALMLPPGFERKAVTFVSSPAFIAQNVIDFFSPESQRLLKLVRERGRLSFKELEKTFGIRQAQTLVSQLTAKGLLTRDYELEKVKVRPKLVPFLQLRVTLEEAREAIARLQKQRAVKQAALLDSLVQQRHSLPISEAHKNGYSPAIVSALVDRGLVRIEPVETKREPISYDGLNLSMPLALTPAQQSALSAIKTGLSARRGGVFLLHGVTGSGKTEIYLQALAEVVKQGRHGIVLVPEIALTPQTIERFAARFPHRVAVLHSGLSLGEQFDEWQRIRDGEFDVVIGPRSALFAPQPDIGLIVIDEEHEWTYKQSDKSPRYHARDAALKLAELAGATLVLGSATPDVETFYRAQRGEYQLLQLTERVTSEGSALPQVEVVDLKEELKAGNRSLLSRSLTQAMNEVLSQQEQAILFLNRRGSATFLQCRNCGAVLRCKRCEVALTYHAVDNQLVCHQCNYRTRLPPACPVCFSRNIKYLGTGIQKVEQEVAAIFQKARLLRWDSDVTQKRHSHEAILTKLRSHEADVLLGTQMIAKGLDLPLITLVGVVSADTSLNLPDFRAGEKTFQLLCQVAGRAGRSSLGGRVIIQTYSPEHYAVQAAAKHDYITFYNTEINYRRQLNYPPFSRLACLTYSHTNDHRCQQEAERLKKVLTSEIEARGASLSIIGPAPAFIHRLRGRFRWQLILRGDEPSTLLSQIPIAQGWSVDIDPMSLI